MTAEADRADHTTIKHVRRVLERSGQTAPRLSVTSRTTRHGSSIDFLDGGTAGKFVLKRIPMSIGDWWRDLTDSPDVEHVLWDAGVTKELPHPLRSAHLDVSSKEETGEWWIVMRHAETTSPNSVHRTKHLIEGMACLHASFWQSEMLSRLQLCRFEGVLAATVVPLISLSTTESFPAWVHYQQALPDFAPQAHWFDLLSTAQHSFYLKLWEKRQTWLPRLMAQPATLTHGDVHSGNFLVQADGSVVVIDWNLAGYKPGCCDAAYYEFVTLWCNALREEMVPAPVAERRHIYTEALLRHMKVLPAQLPWELAWLAAFMQHAPRSGFQQPAKLDRQEHDEILRFLQERMFREAKRIAAKF